MKTGVNWQDYEWRTPFSALIYAAADKLALTGSRNEKFRKLVWLRVIYPDKIGDKYIFNRFRYDNCVRIKAARSPYLSSWMMKLNAAEERFAEHLTPPNEEYDTKIFYYITYKFFDDEGQVMINTQMLPKKIKHRPVYASAKSLANDIKWDRNTSDLYLHLKKNRIPCRYVYCSDKKHRVFFEREEALKFIAYNLVDGTHRPGVNRGRLLGKPGKYAI